MDLSITISITLGFISILLGLVSIYIAITISVKARSIEQKTDDIMTKETIKETEDEDEDDLNTSDIQTAVNWIQTSGRAYDYNASYYYLLALKEYKNGYYSDAEANLKEAIKRRNNNYPAAWFYLGHTYLKQSKTKDDDFYNKAIKCFEKAKALGHKYAKRRLEIMNS
jgi:tetratricopeptide (TPR) repeat protein